MKGTEVRSREEQLPLSSYDWKVKGPRGKALELIKLA